MHTMSVVLALLVPEVGPAGSRADRAKSPAVGVPVPAPIRAAMAGRAARRLASARGGVPPPVVQIPFRTYSPPGSLRTPKRERSSRRSLQIVTTLGKIRLPSLLHLQCTGLILHQHTL